MVHRHGSRRHRLHPWVLCAGMLTSLACEQMNARERGIAAGRGAAEQAAREADEKARADAEEQEQRDLAIAAIENDRGEPPRPLDKQEFEGVISYYCGVCHAPVDYSSGYQEGGSNPPFETVEDLLALKKITPGDAATSRVIERILSEDNDRASPMPPPSADLPSVPPATVQLMADFIDSLPPDASD